MNYKDNNTINIEKKIEAFELAPNPIFVLNHNLQIIEKNKSAAELLQFIKSHSLNKFSELFADEYQDDFHQAIKELKKNINSTDILKLNSKEERFVQIFIHVNNANSSNEYIISAFDFVKKKKVKKELIESRRRYSEIIDNLSEGIFIAENSKVVQINKALEIMLELKEDEILNRSISDLVSEDKRKNVPNKILSKIDNPNNLPLEILLENNRGKKIWTEIRISQLDENTTFGIVSDISERKQYENSLLESEKQYRILAENIKEVILMTDFNLKKSYVSPSIFEYSGYRQDEYLDIPQEQYYTKSSMKKVNLLKRKYGKLVQDKDPRILNMSLSLELERIHKDGYTFWEEHNMSVYSENGVPLALVHLMRNIQKRKDEEYRTKQKEWRLLQAERIANLGSWEFDVDTKKLQFTEQFIRITDKEPLLFVHSFKSAINCFHKQDRLAIIENLRKVYETKEKHSGEYRIITSNGELRFVSTHTEYIQVLNGNDKLVGSCLDITSRKLIENSLRKKEKQLSEAIKSKDKFFSIIAHDLKNPFNTLFNYSQILLQNYGEVDENQKRKMIEDIVDASKFAYNLLDNLLQWSRNQMGRMNFNPQENDLFELIYEVVYIFKKASEEKNVALNANIEPNQVVSCDRHMISTVLRNLITNAIKFSHENSTVDIAIENQERQFLISVKDQGIGMDKEYQKKLFRIDQNISIRGTRNEKGTGLGLILSKEFVERHGGILYLDSQKDKGSTFYFTIPKNLQNHTDSQINLPAND